MMPSAQKETLEHWIQELQRVDDQYETELDLDAPPPKYRTGIEALLKKLNAILNHDEDVELTTFENEYVKILSQSKKELLEILQDKRKAFEDMQPSLAYLNQQIAAVSTFGSRFERSLSPEQNALKTKLLKTCRKASGSFSFTALFVCFFGDRGKACKITRLNACVQQLAQANSSEKFRLAFKRYIEVACEHRFNQSKKPSETSTATILLTEFKTQYSSEENNLIYNSLLSKEQSKETFDSSLNTLFDVIGEPKHARELTRSSAYLISK